MNDFVKYLNSMNSAKSENMNALAESQLLSKYYSKIEVKREISNTITNYLKNTNDREAIILTGHAGDGKTSILIQVLKEFGYFHEGKKPLKIEEEYKDLYYIKDMSELSVQQQKDLLWKFLNCYKNGKSAIIVSNTGPIINTFKDIFYDNIPNEDIEKKILNGIENTISHRIVLSTEIDKFKFRMVNIANINNTYLIEDILKRLLSKELWEECFICSNKDKCPIYQNYIDLDTNFNNVVNQIGKIYFWLSERGTRLTIRQMLAHITFALTSNLECENISNFAENSTAIRKYSFANGFFGAYDNSKLRANALNIKTIKELNLIGLDRKSFGKYDDELFIKENLSFFSKNIEDKLKKIINTSVEGLSKDSMGSLKLRNELRRYFILFAASNEESVNIDNIIISEPFMNYYRAVTSSDRFSKAEKRKLEKIVFIALYRYFVGVYPMKDEEYLYVTLRKDFNVVQNTQMLIAKVPKSDFQIVLEPINNRVEPEKIQSRLVLKIGRSGRFIISAEFLEFMYKFYDGEVFTNLQPSFSYGISKLKVQILKEYKMNEEKLTLIVIQNDKVHKMGIEIIEDEIVVD